MKKTCDNKNSVPPSDISQTLAALAGGMADDFNNILTVVLGACSLIDVDDPRNAELLQYVALIRTSAERAATLSNELVHACAEKNMPLSPNVNTNLSTARDKVKNDDRVSSTPTPLPTSPVKGEV
ncbi:MAG: histidine kinase dimerization/phospho-acceptor domain-containing protein [Desulfuromonadaceae bacterium]|nr:histidine kinase dimerization/phospho-acceptor domain-containing protein [Desulfuromonadaceae bacterium]MDD5105274.1 histidine kinase dimerization/phospho-acceptor domain-containing protein [Desulfuromonadaceae bacterium]